jgi:hypothetical protein
VNCVKREAKDDRSLEYSFGTVVERDN